MGIDLGQVADPTALAVVERLEDLRVGDLAGLTMRDHHHVRFLKRWELMTPYEVIVRETGELLATGRLREAVIIIDQTGPGREPAQLFLQAHRLGRLGAYWPRCVVITGGRETRTDTDPIIVPKRELVGKMQTLLESGRFKVSDALPEAQILRKELLTFQVKTTPTGQDTYEAARERDHDDEVLAVALGCWYRHNLTVPRWIEDGQRGEQVHY